jgi:hypothetical protein
MTVIPFPARAPQDRAAAVREAIVDVGGRISAARDPDDRERLWSEMGALCGELDRLINEGADGRCAG